MSSEIKNRLEICNIEKKFKKNEVLKKLSCTLESGVYAILAPNGVGKTTLMRCIADIYTYNGEILFNGKNIKKQKDSNAIVLARGIGMAPMLPVIKKLKENNNQVTVILDKAPFKDIYVTDYLEALEIVPQEMNLIDKGELSAEAKVSIKSLIKYNSINLIHIAGADILTFKVIDYLDELERKDIDLSCCNNFKMCCGEGVCGSCTTRFSGHRVKRFCKVQANPRDIFEGRRFI